MSLPISSIAMAIVALALVLGLVMLAAGVARRSGLTRLCAPSRTRRLVVQDFVMLDRARKLTIVSCDGRDLLLLTGPTRETVVRWLPGTSVGMNQG